MKKLLTILFLTLFSLPAWAEIQTREIIYQVNDSEFTGYLAYDDSIKDRRPGVLVVHEWWGHNEYARKRARMLAEMGYTAFALDMYGSGKLADHPDTAKAFMQAVTGNFEVMKARFMAGLNLLKEQNTVDDERIAAIGYCMGGGISLGMARTGLDIAGIVVFHGSLGTQTPARPGVIKAEIRVFTGADDPFVPAEQVAAFEAEMEAAGAPYQLVSYKGAKHSFTNPDADRFGSQFNMPLAYNGEADGDSWRQTQKFLKRIFNHH